MSTTSTILVATTATGWTATAAVAVHLFKRVHLDALTGLGNRDALEIQARHASRTRRGGAVGVLLIDVDQFKAVNDTHGHAAGNHVLRTLASRLADARLPGELPIRLHGDEFALWLGRVPSGERGRYVAGRRAHAIRAALAMPITVNGVRLSIAASVGAHTLPARGVSLSALLAGADAAMYAAKRGGRLTSLPTAGRLRDHDDRESA
ncbi:GGDEF domain-containing protein [Saccharothrix sp. NPDC042600]|uniref:GGDEF domain-containing protein n=1 Tax=Saccharothrix TaxID=2071 RepID=UPI0033C59423|nr:hypothetical protein GCM10017745_67210 [Saccharothrix mutabilis subsp. capreolus]